ncbi:ABC transporter substrate-binding protein [Georgenia yuyongxinii]|uniref:ABC transporter substrate-binding protein n=1 Tax=Georgenia yuyongxinii TaxID=2589797 RepID=A0A552WV02_9MICO|nr:ABC transporter substrate-binding protein [Georgenia yuyongxinii]TRW46577.1 ABC transporter substrate-binding protein [Georgenia yuyongxinii]
MSLPRIAPLAGLAGVALLLAGCVSSAQEDPAPSAETSDGAAGTQPSGSDETVTIGVVMASSGFMGPIDTPPLNAMKLEAETINAAGGIAGQQIELKVIDTGTNLDRYASAATELIGGGAEVLVVTCDYDVSSPAALVAESENVLSVAPCIGDPIYGPAGGLELGFSMGSGTPGEATIQAEFAYEQGWTSAVLLTDTTLKYTQNQCEIFEKRFTELGGTIVAKYDYQQGDSVRETVSAVAAGEEPAVIANCGYSPGGATVAKEMRDGGVNAPIISGFGMDGDFWTGGIPGLSDYYVVTYAAKNGDDPNPAVNEAADAYEAAYGERPSVGAFVAGHSTLQAIKAAYEEAGSWDGDKLTAALETMGELDLMAGPTKFSEDLHISVERPMRVLQVKDGKLAFVEERAPEKVTFAG